MRFGGKLQAPFVEQEQRRGRSLLTPVVFDVSLTASPTAIVTGNDEQSFLIRALAVVNDTAGAITGVLRVDGNQWYTQSFGAGSMTRISQIEGMLIDPETDLTGTGNTLRVVGWGVRIAGGDTWVL